MGQNSEDSNLDSGDYTKYEHLMPSVHSLSSTNDNLAPCEILYPVFCFLYSDFCKADIYYAPHKLSSFEIKHC